MIILEVVLADLFVYLFRNERVYRSSDKYKGQIAGNKLYHATKSFVNIPTIVLVG